MKKIIQSIKAPSAPHLYSPAILSSEKYSLEIAGQIGLDPHVGKMVEGGVTAETEQILDNIEALLAEVGWDFSNLAKVRIYLLSMDDYQAVNDIYLSRISPPMPTRDAVAVKELPLGAQIEIDCCASGDTVL